MTNDPLPGVGHTWHPIHIDHLHLTKVQKLSFNVNEAVCPQIGPEKVVVKYARFPWEIARLEVETRAYEWVQDRDIGPKFLGHLTENGRTIGFIIERVEGRHPAETGLSACQAALTRLHALSIRHGDTNKHNFLIHGSRATLIDFDKTSKSADVQQLTEEMNGLVAKLRNQSGGGRPFPK